MKKLLVALFVLLPTLVFAQTTAKLEWDYVGKTLTEVSTYTQTVTVDGTAITTPPTCVNVGSNTTCSVPITPLGAGTHVIKVAASKNGITSETIITGLNPNNAPANPGNGKYTINITINIP